MTFSTKSKRRLIFSAWIIANKIRVTMEAGVHRCQMTSVADALMDIQAKPVQYVSLPV
jgi:hypothetical protein